MQLTAVELAALRITSEADCNGPPSARQYRMRNPQTAPAAPLRQQSLRTRMEIFAGRWQVKLNDIRGGRGPVAKASDRERLLYENWVRSFLEKCCG